MSAPRIRHVARAIAHLRAADATLAQVIDAVGSCRFTPRVHGSHFASVARSIVSQQLSTKAAATIHGRFEALYGGSPTPAAVLATPDEALRAVGLSRQKLTYLKDLAARTASGEVPTERLHELDDAKVIETLTRVKGVGVWTAQMFLMFRLGRPDVLPVLDLGIQTAVQRAYRLRTRPAPDRVARIGKAWRPHATLACWYLWQSLELRDQE